MTARDLQFVRLMNRTEFREYLDEHAPSGSVIESFAKAFVSRNSSAHLLAALIEGRFVDVNLGFREDFMQHRVYGTKDRWSLLHLAAFEDAVDVARTLLDLGASVDAAARRDLGRDGRSPFETRRDRRLSRPFRRDAAVSRGRRRRRDRRAQDAARADQAVARGRRGPLDSASVAGRKPPRGNGASDHDGRDIEKNRRLF